MGGCVILIGLNTHVHPPLLSLHTAYAPCGVCVFVCVCVCVCVWGRSYHDLQNKVNPCRHWVNADAGGGKEQHFENELV